MAKVQQDIDNDSVLVKKAKMKARQAEQANQGKSLFIVAIPEVD